MNILNIFKKEKDPELVAYEEKLAKKQKQKENLKCINYGKPKKDIWYNSIKNLDERSFYDSSLRDFFGFGTKPEEQLRFEEHKKLSRQNECHIFDEKKYCYHTGKELVTNAKAVGEKGSKGREAF